MLIFCLSLNYLRKGAALSEILINARKSEIRVAYVENKQMADLRIDQKVSPTLVGSIYKGRVLRVLPGIQSAFIDIGLNRSAFLHVRDINRVDYRDSSLGNKKLNVGEKISSKFLIQKFLKKGQEIMVQVSKDSLGSKGVRVTTDISFAGRFTVFLPEGEYFKVSRQIQSEKEKKRLEEIVSKIHGPYGVIIRTAGEGASEKELKFDFNYLNKLFLEVQSAYEQKKQVGLIHSEIDIELRVLRDLLNEDVTSILVDDPEIYQKIVQFLTELIPKYKDRVFLHEGSSLLFDQYGIELEISKSLSQQVELKSGGNIVIDETEALVVIDVNTGRFVGGRSSENTILLTNLEAVKEIAHQLRMRNCGGIIIIDFIDMESDTHKDEVLLALKIELQKDRSYTEIVLMSKLGIVEMTRKRTSPSLLSFLCQPCIECEGKGYVKRKRTLVSEILRNIERVENSTKATIVVRCHQSVADCAYQENSDEMNVLKIKLGCEIVIEPDQNFHIEQHEVFLI